MRKLFFILSFILCNHIHGQINVSTLTPSFKGSGGVTIDDSGNVYIADFGDFLSGPDTDGIPNNVMKLDANLNLTVFANDFTGASGNEFDSSGVLYQADIRDNAVYKIENGSRVLYTSTGLAAPVGIAFDNKNNLYVCNCGANNIRKITPSGVSTLFSTGNGLFACPNGMTIDEDGNLYVVNFSNSFIVKIDSLGAATNIGSTSGGNGHVDYDKNTNNLYIANFSGHRIYYLDLDNIAAGAIVIAGTGIAGNADGAALSATFSAPNGIAVSKTGDSLYVNSSATLNNANLNPQYVRVLSNILPTVTAIETNELENHLKVYPNLIQNEFYIESSFVLNASALFIKVWDSNGKTVKTISGFDSKSTSKLTIDVSDLIPGMYYYSIISEDRKAKFGKLVKMQ